MNKKAYLPPEFIEKVKQSTDIVELVSESVRLKKIGHNYQGCCPFHSDTKPSFSVNQQKQRFTCFTGCAESGGAGDVFVFTMNKYNLEFSEAVIFLAKRANLSIPQASKRTFTATENKTNTLILMLSGNFKVNTEVQNEQASGLASALKIDISKLKSLGFDVGYTATSATELRALYANETEDVIKEAKLVGILNSHGEPVFPDQALCFFSGNSDNPCLIFIDQFSNHSVMPMRSIENATPLFGFNQFKANCITKHEGAYDYTGQAINVAPSPLVALQLLSNGVHNVVAPINPYFFNPEKVYYSISKLHRSFDFIAYRFLFDSNETKTSEMLRFIELGIIHNKPNLPSFLPFKADNISELTASLETANETLSIENCSIAKPLTPLQLLIEHVKRSLNDNSETEASTSNYSLAKSLFEAAQKVCPPEQFRTFTIGAFKAAGLSLNEFEECMVPGVRSFTLKRENAYKLILGCSILDSGFAKYVIGPTPGMPNPSLPTLLRPTESMTLALVSSQAYERLNSGIASPTEYIKRFAGEFYPDDVDSAFKLHEVIKHTLQACKKHSLSPGKLGTEMIDHLHKLATLHSMPEDIMDLIERSTHSSNFEQCIPKM